MPRSVPEPRWRTLHFALLTLLGQGPRTGYELTQLMRRPLGYYWDESQGQVYPALADLERAGWATVEAVPGRGPAGRRVHTLTGRGRAALAEWATTPTESQQSRDQLVVKVSALWAADPSAAVGMLQHEEQRHRDRQRTYEEILSRIDADADRAPLDPGAPAFWSRQTLLRGIDYERGRADWCAELVDVLRRAPSDSRVTP